LARPRGGFGYLLDLRRLAADSDKVVPSHPNDSGLWQMVQSGEMPPPDSPSGALTAQEKEVIRAWIAAGAPAEGTPQEHDKGTPPQENAPASSPALRTLRWLGKFHLLLVHFPIALLVAALLGEAWSVGKGRREPAHAVRFCLALAAVFSVPTAALGWLLALGEASSDLLALHRWLGTAAAACAVALAVSSERDVRRGARGWATRLLLLAGVLLVGLAAHFGGLMVHGRHFLRW
jgi:uncharacterized membrane protein